jgi:hypothetical protein
MNITKKKLADFKNIVDTYKKKTDFPVKDAWKKLDNNNLWLRLVGQVNVVGGVDGNDRFFKRPDLLQRLKFTSLAKLNDDELQFTINAVLRDAGIRYASSTLDKCKKSKALVHNYKFISTFKGGFKGLLKEISEYNGDTSELDRVMFLTKHLKFIKNKSARDFLMGLGINTKTLAIDIRIQNIFSHFGLTLPDAAGLNKKSIYDAVEKEIIEKICIPLKIEPVKFDRILFQNYSKIIA